MQIVQKYSLACLKIKLQKRRLWTRSSCWERGIEIELTTKVWAWKKNFSYKFSWLPIIKSCSNQIHVSYAMLPHHERAKQDTIKVTRRTNVKLSHHKGLMLSYLMENEMPLTHHAIKQ
jgi:hypothetical protein